MNGGEAPFGIVGAAGDVYHGHATQRLTSEHLWVDVLANAGPRIVRLGLAGSPRNVLAETPDVGWETPHGRYELLGGHRLWFAPEDPNLVAVPDGYGLAVLAEPGGITLTGPAEAPTGLVRSMTLRLSRRGAALEVCHELRNVSDRSTELAPWSITQLPLGGTILLPQVAATPGHHVHPNRSLVLWPYTSWDDARLKPRDGLLTLDAVAGPNLKVGYFNEAGWVGYVRDGLALVRRFEPQAGRRHPDLGCNVETYIGGRFVELELLGPLTALEPGASAVLVERWELTDADPIADVPDLRRLAALIDRGEGGGGHAIANLGAGGPTGTAGAAPTSSTPPAAMTSSTSAAAMTSSTSAAATPG